MITGEIAPVTVNVYTNGTVIVNAFTVTKAISSVIVNVYNNGSVYTNGCYSTVSLESATYRSIVYAQVLLESNASLDQKYRTLDIGPSPVFQKELVVAIFQTVLCHNFNVDTKTHVVASALNRISDTLIWLQTIDWYDSGSSKSILRFSKHLLKCEYLTTK